MNDFYYNQSVTAAALNGVAVDLGKTDFAVFEDGVPYTVDRLNAITGDLVSKGVLCDGVGCEVSYADGKLKVCPGVIVFDGGAKIRVPSDGVLLNLIGGTSYVCAVMNSSDFSAEIRNTAFLPDDDTNYVLLATVYDTKVICSPTRWAHTDVMASAPGCVGEQIISPGYYTYGSPVATVSEVQISGGLNTVPLVKFNYIIFRALNKVSEDFISGGVYRLNNADGTGNFIFSTYEYDQDKWYTYADTSETLHTLHVDEVSLNVAVSDGTLTVKHTVNSNTHSQYYLNAYIYMTFI